MKEIKFPLNFSESLINYDGYRSESAFHFPEFVLTFYISETKYLSLLDIQKN